MVDLYIEGVLVDVTADVQFAVTKTYENLENPADIVNDWSKSVAIPFSHNNDNLFGGIYNPDRMIVDGAVNVGIYFDPSKKMSFELKAGAETLMRGYAKMTDVDLTNKKYNITLFGELGKALSELKELTASDITGARSALTADFVVQQMIPDFSNFNPMNVTDLSKLIGFSLLNEGLHQNSFDSKTGLDRNGYQYKMATYIESLQSRYKGDSVVGEGITPFQVRQWRSYNITPYIHFGNMFALVDMALYNKCGYHIAVDGQWAQSPYWGRAAMMLQRLQSRREQNVTDTYSISGWTGYNEYTYFQPQGSKTLSFKLRLLTDEMRPSPSGATAFYGFGLGNQTGLRCTISHIVNGVRVNSKIVLLCGTNYTPTDPWDYKYTNFFNDDRQSFWVNNKRVVFQTDIEIPNFFQDAKGAESLIELDFSLDSNTSQRDFVYWYSDGGGRYLTEAYRNKQLSVFVEKGNGETSIYDRSNDIATMQCSLADFWDNGVTPFEQIIKYTKMFNMKWMVDELHKVIIIMPRSTYFSGSMIEDWSDKVDLKDFKLQPILSDTKYLRLGYDTNGTDIGKKYSEQIGHEFGDAIVKTDYGFNENTTDLISGIKAPVMVSDNVLYSENWNTCTNFTRELALPYFQDSKKAHTDTFGAFYFISGIVSVAPHSLRIFEDSAYEKDANIFCYSDSRIGGVISREFTQFNRLNIEYAGKLFTFGNPSISYDKDTTYIDSQSIYTQFWQRYLNERYSKRNKKVTLRVRLTLNDIKNFTFSKFVKIGNQLYHVNKIIDFDYNSQSTTKVELISVTDMGAYKN